MAWSTRQLAEMAGTTVKSVRYYHQLGLLDEPERLGNGSSSTRCGTWSACCRSPG